MNALKFDKELLKSKKYFINGVTHMLVLWIISKQPIHGYGLMKKINEFYSINSDENSVMQVNSSKIYPILKKLENEGFISGEWSVNNNKQVKCYSITADGEELLDHIRNNWNSLLKDSLWSVFFEDMIGVKL